MDRNHDFLWSADLANSRPLRPLVGTFDVVSAGGKGSGFKVSTSITSEHQKSCSHGCSSPHFLALWVTTYPYLSKILFGRLLEHGISFYHSSLSAPGMILHDFHLAKGTRPRSSPSRRVHQNQRNWLRLLLQRNCWCWQRLRALASVLWKCPGHLVIRDIERIEKLRNWVCLKAGSNPQMAILRGETRF